MNDSPLGPVTKTGKAIRSTMSAALTDTASRQLRERTDNEREAYELLGLINAEFQSDPTSTQCFDLRVVARVKSCVETVERMKKISWLLMP